MISVALLFYPGLILALSECKHWRIWCRFLWSFPFPPSDAGYAHFDGGCVLC